MDNMFKIEDETGKIRDAKLITIIELEKKEYAVYSIDRDENDANIFVSRISKNENDKDILVDITDPKEKEEIDKIVKEVIKQIVDKEK